MARDSEAWQTSGTRREDQPTLKHDLRFSNWEVLIGPSDWKDHSSGKDGAERYRVHNLPAGCSDPGVYELAIGVTHSDDDRVIRELHKDCIIPVYVGASGDVRARLQQYGRHGAHLDHGNSASAQNGRDNHRQAGPGLFEEIFGKEHPILFRWAPVGSREEAEKIEAELLDKYDYAWNKGGNGPTRRDDVREGLDKRAFCTGTSSRGTRKGKEQASEKKPLAGGGSSSASPPREVEHPDDLSFNVTYRHRLVREPRFSYLGNAADKEEHGTGLITGTSGVILKEELPVAERKEGDSHRDKQIIHSELHTPPEVEDNKDTHRCSLPTVTLAGDDNRCGAMRGDGSLCRNPPEKGRKRCGVHKGQRVIGSPLLETTAIRMEGGGRRCEDHQGRRITGASLGGGSDVWATGFSASSSFCGVTMNNGAPCTAAPVPGRKRCLRHKGRRI